MFSKLVAPLLALSACAQPAMVVRPDGAAVAPETGLAGFDVTLKGASEHGATLRLYAIRPEGLGEADWETPIGDVEDLFRAEIGRDPVGSITRQGREVSFGQLLGHWRRDKDALTAQVAVAPGTYTVVVEDANLAGVVRLRPLTVRAGKTKRLELDLSSCAVWTVMAREVGGGPCNDVSQPHVLEISGARFRRWDGSRRPAFYFADTQGPNEARFFVRTFDGAPSKARLYGCPGVNGQLATLRPQRIGDDADADLIVCVPPAVEVSAAVDPVAQGGLVGLVYGSEAEPTDIFPLPILPVPMNRSGVRSVAGSVRIAVRGHSTRGIIIERCQGEPLLLRDWFDATPAGVTLVGNGRGRFLQVTSMRSEPLKLVLLPNNPKHRPFHAGRLTQDQSRNLWIPDSAKALEWRCAGQVLGASRDLGAERLSLR